jgi:hypothetical protein
MTAIAMVLALVVAAGCGDECISGETACDGKRILYCELGAHDAGPNHWRPTSTVCGDHERCTEIVDDRGYQDAVCVAK